MQRLAAVVEAVGTGVGGKEFLEVELDAEQVADGVLVLDAVESPQHGPTLRDPTREELGQRLHLFLGGARLPLGRHLARVHAAEHALPAFAAGVVGEVRREPVERKVPLGLLARMAAETVPREERLDLIVEALLVRRSGLTERRRDGQDRKRDPQA